MQRSEALLKEYSTTIERIDLLNKKLVDDKVPLAPKQREQLEKDLKAANEQADKIEIAAKNLLNVKANAGSTAYAEALANVNKSLDTGITRLNNVETGLRVAHTATVVVAATAITVGSAGAGSGVGVAMVYGTVGGTAVGALGNTVEAGGHIARGNKSTEQALTDAALATGNDAKTAFTSSASAAGGHALGKGLSGLTQSTALKTVAQQVVAPATVQLGNSAVATTEQIYRASQEFNQVVQSPEFIRQHGPVTEMKPEALAEFREKFFQERGLSWGQIARNTTIDVGTSVVGGVVGARLAPPGAGADLRGKLINESQNFLADVGIGMTADTIRNGKLTVNGATQQFQNAMVGRLVANSTAAVSANRRQTTEAESSQTQDTPSSAPTGPSSQPQAETPPVSQSPTSPKSESTSIEAPQTSLHELPAPREGQRQATDAPSSSPSESKPSLVSELVTRSENAASHMGEALAQTKTPIAEPAPAVAGSAVKTPASSEATPSEGVRNSSPRTEEATPETFQSKNTEPTTLPSTPRSLLPRDRLHRIEDLKVNASFSSRSIEVNLSGNIEGKGAVTATVSCRATPSGEVMVVESSGASNGGGPIAYDIAMEISTKLGMPLCSDRKRVSDSALRVWDYYLRQRPDVTATELPVGEWHMGSRADKVLSEMTEDRSTWPSSDHPIWPLWHGYTKPPDIIDTLSKTGQIELKDLRNKERK